MTEHKPATRQTGATRRSELLRARIAPDFAERVDRACLATGESQSEFVRIAVDERLARVAPQPEGA